MRATLLLLVLAGMSTYGQGTLIGLGIRNGGFEDGVAAPWGSVSVSQGPVFADQGNWYGAVQASLSSPEVPIVRGVVSHHLVASPANGYDFVLTFRARNGLNEFDSVSAGFSARSTGDVAASRVTTQVLSPALAASEWRTYETHCQFGGDWDGGGSFSLFITFLKFGATVGNPYVGYLDNITLQQVPEPSAFSVLGLGGLLLISLRRHRHERRVEHHSKRGPCA